MRGSSDANSARSKWTSRASTDPFASASLAAPDAQNGHETTPLFTDQQSDGKENRVPLIDRNWGHPNVSMDRSRQQTTLEEELLPPTLDFEPSTSSTLLGKRPNPTEDAPRSQKSVYRSAGAQDSNNIEIRQLRDPLASANAVTHFESRALELHGYLQELEDQQEENAGYGSITMLVDDFSHIGQLHFGSVALGERRSRQLTLENASELGNARVKYEGYAMVRNGESEPSQPKTRFKCDLHVCVVDALKSVTLRVTFEPLSVDVGKEITAMLKFTVNDRFKLQCRATGKVTPRVPRLNRFGRLRKAKTSVDTVVVAPGAKHTQPPRIPATNSRQRTPLNARNTHFTISSALAQSEREPEQEPVLRPRPKVGDKRQSSVTIDFSPPRNGSKRRKTEPPRTLTPRKSIGASQDPDTKKPYSGSWWKQRQEFYDENWMAKQTEGFTKWINYVLLDGTSQRLGGGDTEGEEQDVGVKRRFDFSSLRVLAQKRMESKWAQAAVELYHSPNMDDILFNLQDEIGNKGLLFRADRPVYADVGLQEDLISLLNNYHPVWLCLGLYAVLGSQVMRQEKCSLRAIFRSTTAKATSGKKENSPPDRKMPRVLRRVILNHLVKDAHVARNYRLVKNLMTPLDGSTADRNNGGNSFTNTKKNINGREYFDSLTQSFMLKFLMLVIFLDRAIERKADKFPHFPCLFRIVPSVKKAAPGKGQTVTKSSKRNTNGNDDALWVKNSQVFVTEFCRLFLASEGRIDKHLKHLGYTLKHQQTPLDEIDLEVRSLEVDLRDGIRLAKLMEALTTTAVPSATEQDGEVIPQPKALSTFLRVPALSRLQKVHNVEICLHFLQDKCGASVLDNLKSNSCRGEKKHRLSGRVRVSSSGFAGLHSKVDAKLVENLAKDIVNGHREKTLALLWKLISSFQLQSLVDAETMRREVVNVVKRMSFRAKDFFDHQQHNAPLVHTDEHECYGLLLEWCRAVCANYNVEVSDFSASFADGKALCYLLHYYHPMLLSKSDMLSTTSDLHTPDVQGISEKALLANEQRHFAIINDRVKQLGEVPVLMPQQYNTKNPPEEKMVVTFVCYLQSRLMDSYSEIHAASRLKRWWKSPLIRLKLHRKKNRSARTIQRFWYTSSHKRLAIRQCRKLLRAAHLVKSSVQTWTARKHYIRFRRSVVVIQRAFRARRQLKINGDSRGAVLVIEYHWRKKLRWKREEERRLQSVMQRKVAQRVRSRSACAVIERHWLQRLSREAARLVRQQMIADRQLAVIRIQTAWRQSRQRVVARKQRMHSWQQMKRAARVIKRTWRAFQHRREETQRVVALQRFEQMMKEKELQKRHLKLKQKVETRAVKCVQRCFRQFTLRKRKVSATKLASVFRGRKQKIQFQKQKRAVVLLQRNARVWRRRRQLSALSQFYSMLKTYQRMRASEAQRRMIRIQELKHKVEKRAACRILAVYQSYRDQKRALAAMKIQSLARCLRVRRRYCTLRQSALLLQKNVRIWRRQGQLRALLTFRSMLLSYRRMQREEEEHRERVRQDRIQRLQQSVGHRAAYRIQSVYRFFVHHKQMVAATLIQATYRGFKEQQQYTKTSACVRVMQRAIRSWLAMTKFRQALRLHRAAVTIQKCVRGRLSRRIRFNFYDLQTQLRRLRVLTSCWKIEFWYVGRTKKYRKKRTLMVRARWTQLSAGITRKRIADVKKIEMCWRSFCLKSAIDTRIQHKRQLNSSAQRVQVWWLGLCCKWAERERRAEEKRQREMEVMALAMAKTRAERIVGSWLRQRVIIPYRERNVHYVAVRRLQAWSRGMLVRLHQSAPEVTQQRKKLSKMKLVGQESHANSVTTSTTLQHLRVKTSEARSVQTEQPVTLGGRLDMALHMLLHGKRLQDMLFASHTIEVCTRYSRECCRKCVQLQISSTIFAAIRGLNRSRPHVELLHQLLLVLKNLTVYRRSADKRKPNREVATDTDDRLDVDMRALDTLVDLLHIHRDMHHVFVLSADVIKYYLTMLKPLADGNEGVRESWSEAEKRLTGLQELLSRKLALFNATASFRRVNQIPEKPSGNSLMRKMNPKTAVAIMEELVTLLER